MISIRVVDDGRRYAVERWSKPTGGERVEGKTFPIHNVGVKGTLAYVETQLAEIIRIEPEPEPEPAA